MSEEDDIPRGNWCVSHWAMDADLPDRDGQLREDTMRHGDRATPESIIPADAPAIGFCCGMCWFLGRELWLACAGKLVPLLKLISSGFSLKTRSSAVAGIRLRYVGRPNHSLPLSDDETTK